MNDVWVSYWHSPAQIAAFGKEPKTLTGLGIHEIRCSRLSAVSCFLGLRVTGDNNRVEING